MFENVVTTNTLCYWYHNKSIPHTEKQGSCRLRCSWAARGQRSGLPMGILPCKLCCPLLPYMETVGSSVGSGVGCPWEFCHANYAAHCFHIWKQWGSSVGSGVGYPWEFCHANYAAHCFHIRKQWVAQWAAHFFKIWRSGQLSGQWSGLPMGILPCKLCCPLLPYKKTVGSSVGSPLLQNMKKWAAQWAVEWAAHGNFAHGKLGSPIFTSMEIVGSSVGSPLNCPLLKLKWKPWFTCKKIVAHV